MLGRTATLALAFAAGVAGAQGPIASDSTPVKPARNWLYGGSIGGIGVGATPWLAEVGFVMSTRPRR